MMSHVADVAVVVGAARGIGAAITRRLADNGVDVVAVDVDSAVSDLVDELNKESAGRSVAVQGDARSDTVLHDAMDAACDLPGALRYLVHLAYVQRPTRRDAPDAAEWGETFDVGVRSAWDAANLFAGHAAAPASIVLTSSNQAWRPHPNNAAYAAAKTAVQSVTRSLAVELGPRGIRCNAVAPGYVAVERNSWRRSSPETQASITERNPLNRLTSPEDVAHVVAFLLGPRTGAVNGVCIPIDGGETVYGIEVLGEP